MRKSHIFLSAVSLATLTTVPFSNAGAAWAPTLPNDAGIIAEVDNQTSPLTFPRPDQKAPEGGILGSFKINSMKGHSALIKSYPVEVRVSKAGRLQVRNLKTGDLITHSKALTTGVSYKYQVSCDANGWSLVVNGTSIANNGSKHPTCLADAWGKPVIAASSATGTNALSGTLDLTWYTDDGTGSGGGSGGGGEDDSGGGDGGATAAARRHPPGSRSSATSKPATCPSGLASAHSRNTSTRPRPARIRSAADALPDVPRSATRTGATPVMARPRNCGRRFSRRPSPITASGGMAGVRWRIPRGRIRTIPGTSSSSFTSTAWAHPRSSSATPGANGVSVA